MSGVFAEVWLKKMEADVIEDMVGEGRIGVYVRYVDDVLVGYRDESALSELKGRVQGWHERLRVTWEEEDEEGWISFLDVKFRSREKLEVGLFRKSIAKPMYVRWDSYGPVSRKLAATDYFCKRLWEYGIDEEQRRMEIRWVRWMAKEQGIPEHVVERCIYKWKEWVRRRRGGQVVGEGDKSRGKWKNGLTYVEGLSQELVKGVERERGWWIRKGRNLKDVLCKKKNEKVGDGSLWDKKGVYRIECKKCGKSYVGQTGRSVRVRMEEHVKSIKKFGEEKEEKENKDKRVERLSVLNMVTHVWYGKCGMKGLRDMKVELLLEEKEEVNRKLWEAVVIDREWEEGKLFNSKMEGKGSGGVDVFKKMIEMGRKKIVGRYVGLLSDVWLGRGWY